MLMKNWRQNISDHLKWILYFMITLDQRNAYSAALKKGYHVEKIHYGVLWHKLDMDRTKKPEREYLTYKEYMSMLNRERENNLKLN